MKETLEEKERRLLDNDHSSPMQSVELLKAKLTKEIDKSVYKNFGFIPSTTFGTGKTHNIDQLFEGVKPFFDDQEKLKQKAAEVMAGATGLIRDNKENIEKVTNMAKTLSGFFSS